MHGFEDAVGSRLQRQVDVLGQFGQAAEAIDEIFAETDGVRGGEAQAFQAFDFVHRFEQLHERAAPLDLGKFVASVKIDDLAEEGDFLAAASDQFAHFADNAADAAAAFGAARVGHDAESAAHVAALHDRDEGARRDGGMVADGFLRAGFLVGVDDGETQVVHGRLVGHFAAEDGVDVVGHPVEFLRADHQIEVGDFREQGGAAALGHAAEEPVDGMRPLFLLTAEQAHLAERFLLGHVAHAAGVEKDDVRFAGVAGHFVTPGHEHLRDLFGVALVHLATVGFEKHLGHRATKLSAGPGHFQRGLLFGAPPRQIDAWQRPPNWDSACRPNGSRTKPCGFPGRIRTRKVFPAPMTASRGPWGR